MKTVPTFTATIYVGMKHRYDGEITDRAVALNVIQEYVNSVGLCVTVTDTQFVYTNGGEPGLIVGLINYPRFDRCRARGRNRTRTAWRRGIGVS